jgi:hypothetical protein
MLHKDKCLFTLSKVSIEAERNQLYLFCLFVETLFSSSLPYRSLCSVADGDDEGEMDLTSSSPVSGGWKRDPGVKS